MNSIFISSVLLLMASSYSYGAPITIDLKSLSWANLLKEQKITTVNLCGSSKITNTRTSINNDFFVGVVPTAYVISDLLPYDKYWLVLKTQNKKAAILELEKQFAKSTLWQISKNGDVVSLGHPEIFDAHFTATVKDCIEGAKTTLGGDCSIYPVESRTTCCSEKFQGPQMTWKVDQKEYVLNYTPDPSVSFKVVGEEIGRFCQVIDSIAL